MNEQRFNVDSVGHDIRSTKFAKDGCCDTLLASEFKDPTIVAYAIENHPCDSRITLTDNGVVQTLNARMGTGGGNTPFVLITNKEKPFESASAVYSHPMSSVIYLTGDISPTITAKLAKLASDGPLVLTMNGE